MNKKLYDPEQMKDAVIVLDILQKIPESKRGIARMLIDTYINGVIAGESLSSSTVERLGV